CGGDDTGHPSHGAHAPQDTPAFAAGGRPSEPGAADGERGSTATARPDWRSDQGPEAAGAGTGDSDHPALPAKPRRGEPASLVEQPQGRRGDRGRRRPCYLPAPAQSQLVEG